MAPACNNRGSFCVVDHNVLLLKTQIKTCQASARDAGDRESTARTDARKLVEYPESMKKDAWLLRRFLNAAV